MMRVVRMFPCLSPVAASGVDFGLFQMLDAKDRSKGIEEQDSALLIPNASYVLSLVFFSLKGGPQ